MCCNTKLLTLLEQSDSEAAKGNQKCMLRTFVDHSQPICFFFNGVEAHTQYATLHKRHVGRSPAGCFILFTSFENGLFKGGVARPD
jgi:hypothetical protein